MPCLNAGLSPPRASRGPSPGGEGRDRLRGRLARPLQNLPRHAPSREDEMKRADLTEKLLDIKRERGFTWKHVCEQIGGMSPVMIAGGVLGQQKMTKPMAAAAAKLFGLTK